MILSHWNFVIIRWVGVVGGGGGGWILPSQPYWWETEDRLPGDHFQEDSHAALAQAECLHILGPYLQETVPRHIFTVLRY